MNRTNRARLPSRSEKGETPSSRQESQLSDALRRWLPLPKSGERKTGDSNSKPAEKVKRRKATSYIAPAQPKTAFE